MNNVPGLKQILAERYKRRQINNNQHEGFRDYFKEYRDKKKKNQINALK